MTTKSCGLLTAMLAAVLVTGCGGSPAPVGSALVAPVTGGTTLSLAAAAAQKQVLYGVATMSSYLNSDPAFADQVAQNAAVLVPENELKWDTTEPQPGIFTFSSGDALLAFATAHHMQLRGHTLVWNKQLPSWAGADPATAQQQLVGHITAEVRHFAGHVQSWDVVNEAIEPLDGRADGLRNDVWMQSLGPGYIETAFRAAAAADPNAVLVINDYGLEYGDPGSDARRTAMLALLTRLKSQGVPVGALGIQGHLDASQNSNFSASKFSAFLKQVAALGLKIYITELDVVDAYVSADIATRDAAVAQAYSSFLTTALQQPAVSLVVTWGLSDKYTWIGTFYPRPDGLAVRPLPLDTSMQNKPAYTAMINAFAGAPGR